MDYVWLATVYVSTPEWVREMSNDFEDARGKNSNYSFSVLYILPSYSEIVKRSMKLYELQPQSDIATPTANE